MADEMRIYVKCPVCEAEEPMRTQVELDCAAAGFGGRHHCTTCRADVIVSPATVHRRPDPGYEDDGRKRLMIWSVTIDTAGAEVTGDEAEAVLDLLFDVNGVAMHGPPNTLGVTVAVTATSCRAAIERATARLEEACDAAALGARKIVGIRAIEWGRFEAELEQPTGAPVASS